MSTEEKIKLLNIFSFTTKHQGQNGKFYRLYRTTQKESIVFELLIYLNS